MKQKLVSIVMPVYNVENYISAAIESVLQQDYKNWELLIIDDGSQDKSIEISERYQKTENRIKIIHKSNGGLSDARNFGLERAEGEYIHFFDSDDWISTDFYSSMINALTDSDDFVICGYYKDVELDDGKIVSKEIRCDDIESSNINPNKSYRELFVSHFNYAWNKLFRYKFLIENNLRYTKGLSIIEDKEFMSRAIQYKPNFRFINYLGYHYQVRKRLTLNNNVTEKFVECNMRGVLLQKDILSFFCKNEEINNFDGGTIAYEGIRWTMHCLFQPSNKMKFKIKKKSIKYLLSDTKIQNQLSFFKTVSFKDTIMKSLMRRKLVFALCFIYELLNHKK